MTAQATKPSVRRRPEDKVFLLVARRNPFTERISAALPVSRRRYTAAKRRRSESDGLSAGTAV